ncbi:YDG/SRA domain-containing protein [Modestobacter sp. Leaf380]|uniref:YDG/SRA domain-containing protein n=1 Tax=Modestobacter sp. Leaf380 TaxID=1736356 RepID=UPI0009EC7B82|nr:YDG/SRA domain-containing protein [Modestobacter sp. Leaf380]
MALGLVYGVLPGATFTNRRALHQAGVHRDIRRGICGSGLPGQGVESVLLSGGYEDDEDLGDLLFYTGQGGRVAGKQVADQLMQGVNASLALNVDSGQPVRLVRSTAHGFRYDGLYGVEDAWVAPGLSGYLICRYRLRSRTPLAEVIDGRANRESATGEVKRRQTTLYRLVRDGALPDQVKALYDYRCQICSMRIETAAGPYAEGAHLQALGGGDPGPDALANLLCLCPNHHVQLDHGGLYIAADWTVRDARGLALGQLTVHPDHPLDPAFARAHRQLFGHA